MNKIKKGEPLLPSNFKGCLKQALKKEGAQQMERYVTLVVEKNKDKNLFLKINKFCMKKYHEDGILKIGKEFNETPDVYFVVMKTSRKIVGTIGIKKRKFPNNIKSNKKIFEVMRYCYANHHGISIKEKMEITKLLFEQLVSFFGKNLKNCLLFMITFDGVISIFKRVSGIKDLFVETDIRITSMPKRSMGFLEKRKVKLFIINNLAVLKNRQH